MTRKRAVRTRTREEAAVPQKRWRLDEAFEEFLRAKRLEQLKPRTLQDHQAHFGYLLEWLESRHPEINFVDQMTVHILRQYVEYMLLEKAKWGGHQFIPVKQTGLSPVTVNVRLRTTKCLFRWWTEEGMCAEDPTTGIHLLRTEEDTLRGFTQDEVQRLLAQPDQNTYVGYRDFSLMLLLLDSGGRISETLALTVGALDLERGAVHFAAGTTKTRKGRTVPLSKKTIDSLRELMEENRENFDGEQHMVFLTATGDPLERHVVTSRMTAYGQRAGITGCRVSPHTFRHTFARMYLQNGGDAFTLQRLLGHSSMEMVRKYVQLEQGDLKASHAKFSPLTRMQF